MSFTGAPAPVQIPTNRSIAVDGGSLFGRTLRALKPAFFPWWDLLCTVVPVPRRRTAVIVRLDAVGDFFIWLQSGAADIARFAKQRDRHVVIVANAAWAQYARFIGLWDEVIAVEPVRFMKRPWYRLRTLARLRRLGADLLIQPRAAREYLLEDAISRMSGASLRIGSAGTWVNREPNAPPSGDRWYDRLISVNQDPGIHETLRNDEFVKQLTGKASSRVDLGKLHTVRAGPVVAIALGAGVAGRVWPVEKLAEVIRRLKDDSPSRPIVLFGARSERAIAERLTELVGSLVESRVEKTTLREFVDAIASSALVICNDSSAFHVSMCLEKNVVCFLGGGHFGWFAPYPPGHPGSSRARVLSVRMDCFWCNWKCRYPPGAGGAFRCVESIPVQAAVDAVLSFAAAERSAFRS